VDTSALNDALSSPALRRSIHTRSNAREGADTSELVMRVARILRRTVVVGAITATLGVGMAVAATPAQAMPRNCDVIVEAYRYWFDLYVRETARPDYDKALTAQYLRIANAAQDLGMELGCQF
jgi:hypothetical protein